MALTIYLLVSFIVAFSLSFLSQGLGPKKSNAVKKKMYESGNLAEDFKPIRFQVHFFRVAILFVVFDLVGMAAYPWALSLGQIGYPGYLTGMIFFLWMSLTFLYAWKRGGLKWH